MKSIALLVCTFLAHFAFATETHSGFVNKMHTSYYFQALGTKAVHRIVTDDPAVSKILMRMAPGDFIQAHGEIDLSARTFRLRSVDFVALHRLLGPWISQTASVVFNNFHLVTVKTLSGVTTEFRYSITPTEEGDWMIFLSDAKKTVVASLHMDPSMTVNGRSTLKRFQLKFLEFETGNVIHTLKLERP